MAKIVVNLNSNSINNAIRRLEKYKMAIPQMQKDIVDFACRWLIGRANWYIENSDLGSLVKSNLQKSWSYVVNGNTGIIRNSATVVKKHRNGRHDDVVPLAILVEFGVGVVGQGSPHPEANREGYQYNVPTDCKDDSGMWYFYTNSEELDIPLHSVEDIRGFNDHRGEQGKRIVVGTRGSKGVWYAYNAIVDARMDLQNPNGYFGQEWARIKERYWS